MPQLLQFRYFPPIPLFSACNVYTDETATMIPSPGAEPIWWLVFTMPDASHDSSFAFDTAVYMQSTL
jgi:hypothetical protein